MLFSRAAENPLDDWRSASWTRFAKSIADGLYYFLAPHEYCANEKGPLPHLPWLAAQRDIFIPH